MWWARTSVAKHRDCFRKLERQASGRKLICVGVKPGTMSNNRVRIIATGFVIGALATIGIAQRTQGTSSAIRESALRAHVKFLSDDRLEGRGTGAKGGETAALYVAEQ